MDAETRLAGAAGFPRVQQLSQSRLLTRVSLSPTGQDGVLVECIIDPSFAEQWGIARPTPAYARVVAALPQVAFCVPAALTDDCLTVV